MGAFDPKDPALLSWRWTDKLMLQVFPVMPKQVSTVEYTLTVPTRYANGRYFVSYPRVSAGAAKLAINEDSLYFVVGFYTHGDIRTSVFFTIPFLLLSQFRGSGQYRFSVERCQAAAVADSRIVRL